MGFILVTPCRYSLHLSLEAYPPIHCLVIFTVEFCSNKARPKLKCSSFHSEWGWYCGFKGLNQFILSSTRLSLLEIDFVTIDFVTHRFRYSVARDLHCCLVIQSEHGVLIDI